MKKIKRFLVLVLSVLMPFATSTAVFADDYNPDDYAKATSIYVDEPTVSPGDTLTIHIHMTHPEQITSLGANYVCDDNVYKSFEFHDLSSASGDYTQKVLIDDTFRNGYYHLERVVFQNQEKNVDWTFASDMNTSGSTFSVQNSSDDKEGPVLQSVTMDKHQVKMDDGLFFTIEATDQTKVSRINLFYGNEENGINVDLTTNVTDTEDTYYIDVPIDEKAFTFSDADKYGSYTLKGAYMEDQYGNTSYLSDEELAKLNENGANTFEVLKDSEDNDDEVTFADMPANKTYRDAIQWAVKNNITSGTSATTFSPYATCNRAQIATFIWRACGAVEYPTVMTFTDMPKNETYRQAISWAVLTGVTSGTSATTFSPTAPCTRAQIVTLLYRAAGSPEVKNTATQFKDMPKNKTFQKAISWAVENKVTAGTSDTTFSPSAPCTRAQCVTLLQKASKLSDNFHVD